MSKIKISKKTEYAKKEIDKLLQEMEEFEKTEFEKTEVHLKTLERIIKIAKKEKWGLNYFIEELEYDVKLWRGRYNKEKGENQDVCRL